MNYDTHFFKNVMDNIADGVYFVDCDRQITYWNKGAERITGFMSDEVIGSKCFDNLLNHVDGEGTQLCHGKCPLAYCIEDQKYREADVFLHHKNGHRVPVKVRANPLCDDDGKVIGAVELFTDSTTYMEAMERIKALENEAYLDFLTQLPNRNFLDKTLFSRFEEWQRNQWSLGVVMFDIDHFKKFNDQYGHKMGDNVLCKVSETFQRNARAYDVIGRWGGEEFLAIVPNINSKALMSWADRFRLLIEKTSLRSEDKLLAVTVSAGATIAREADTIETLTKRADELLYQSKENGRNRVTID
ncbi:MAG: diguanylate cyclase [Candidatus Hinthialibacter antarcticus]|nr:diguanylate cyclase [Candidatus Hinthialibacter antarcticus]